MHAAAALAPIRSAVVSACLAACLAGGLLAGPLAGSGAAQAAEPSGSLAIRAARIHLGDGRSVEDGVVLIQDGRIREVGRGVTVPAGVPVIEHAGSVSPGLIACRSQDGTEGRAADTSTAFLPGMRIADVYEPGHRDFERAVAAGITTLELDFLPLDVIGGVTAVVKTHGSEVLARDAHLSIALTASALVDNRQPTSFPGALAELERRFAAPEGVLARVAGGQLPVLLRVGPRHEIARAVEFARKHELRGALSGAPLAGELAAVIAPSGLAVVLSPLGPGAERRVLDSAAALADAGIPFAFGLDAPGESPEILRFSAAQCMAVGLSGEAALRALTGDAARIAGVAERVGRIERGLDADLVLWSGEPLDLTSAVEAVFVSGRRVPGIAAARPVAHPGAKATAKAKGGSR